MLVVHPWIDTLIFQRFNNRTDCRRNIAIMTPPVTPTPSSFRDDIDSPGLVAEVTFSDSGTSLVSSSSVASSGVVEVEPGDGQLKWESVGDDPGHCRATRRADGPGDHSRQDLFHVPLERNLPARSLHRKGRTLTTGSSPIPRQSNTDHLTELRDRIHFLWLGEKSFIFCG